MTHINTIKGDSKVNGARFALVAGRFNSFIVDHLVQAAVDTLRGHGTAQEHIDLVHVPGAFEIPLLVQRMAAKKKYDAIIALGCVIRGATPHFEYVAGECVRGIATVALE